MEQDDIKRLFNRYIAKTLTNLQGHITPLIEKEIKSQFRYLEEDIRTLENIGTKNANKQQKS